MARHVGARVYNSAAITLTSGASTALTFDSERYDYDNIHSTVTNTGRLTATTAGIYHISGHARFDVNATNQRFILIRLNGSTTIANQTAQALAGSLNTALTVSTIYELAAGDYVELLAYQNSGGNLDVTATGNHSPEFMMMRVG
jgi:hypothetical protein